MEEDEGYCSGFNVYLDQGRMTEVLGPDGEPVRYHERRKMGFDLRPVQRAAKRRGKVLRKLAKR